MRSLAMLLLIPILATACNKDQPKAIDKSADVDVRPATTASATPKVGPGDDVLPKDAPAEFAAWDMPTRAKAWEGARLTEQSLGFKIAIEVKGAVVKTWDGKTEKTLAFALESPCSAKFIEKSANGEQSTIGHFTVKNGQLIEGLGNTGSRNGKTAIACVSNKILTLDATGKCLAWDSFGKWSSEPATCGFEQQGGKEVFVAKQISSSDYTLDVDGDALVGNQVGPSKTYPDFAAAKSDRDKK